LTLATRCPKCATVFRVVQDQLRVSEGWVRCGRCTQVFNAVENLVDLELPRRSDPKKAKRRRRSSSSTGRTSKLGDITEGWSPADEWSPPTQVPSTRPADLDGDADPPMVDSSMSRFGPDADEPPRRIKAADVPSFVRDFDRAKRWRKSRARTVLALASMMALLLLLGQVVFEYRDLAAARWPAARTLLAQACSALGCRIDAPRAIDALAVDSSGLVRVEKSDLYRLSVALRNRGGLELMLPALDLTLTDTEGRLIARRVLLASELGTTRNTLDGGRELVLQATLKTTGEPVAGYTIELFYP
jgi:predicted Zn finger-like uncharacterized protein